MKTQPQKLLEEVIGNPTTTGEWTAEQIQAIWARTFTTTQFFHDMANAINAALAAEQKKAKAAYKKGWNDHKKYRRLAF